MGWSKFLYSIGIAFITGILTLAATQGTVIKGMFLLTIYSLGLGIPFIITGFSIGIFMRFFERYKRFVRFGEIFAGVLLMTIGALIFFDNLTVILRFVPSFFYKFSM